jgi:hypothetical protein
LLLIRRDTFQQQVVRGRYNLRWLLRAIAHLCIPAVFLSRILVRLWRAMQWRFVWPGGAVVADAHSILFQAKSHARVA